MLGSVREDRCRWGEYLLVGSRSGIEPRQETNEEGKEKVLPHPMPVCLSPCWQTLGRPVDLTASLSSQWSWQRWCREWRMSSHSKVFQQWWC